MSVIVAIKDNNRVVVGVDVRMSISDTYVDSYQRRPKAFHINQKKDIIVGGAGNIGMVDVFKQIISEYQEKDLYKIDRSFIVKYIIPTLVVSIREYNMLDNEGRLDGVILLAIKDKAFFINSNFTVDEVVKYQADGSGRDAVLGSLYTTSKMNMTPEDKIKLAIEAAGSCINTVSKVSYIGDTAGMQFITTPLENSK